MILTLLSPLDSGPIYHETDMGRLPVEPFNTVSNLIFLFSVIYYSIKIYPYFSKYRFLSFVLPILLTGFIGGTMYHATRSHEGWLLMDWVPILVLSMSTVLYFFYKLRLKRLVFLVLIVTPILLSFLMRWAVPFSRPAMNLIGYVMMAITVLLPILTYLIKTNWLYGKRVGFAVLFFCIAIFFRTMDANLIDIFPMGTHWLWHLFGGLSVHTILGYLFYIKRGELSVNSKGL